MQIIKKRLSKGMQVVKFFKDARDNSFDKYKDYSYDMKIL